MKRTIAGKTAAVIFLMLMSAMLILLVATYQIISRTVAKENRTFSESVSNLFCDLLYNRSQREEVPVDVEHAEDVLYIGEYLCRSLGLDYAYLYTIDEENSTITYIATAYAEENPEILDNMVGRTVECEMGEEELAVWHGEQDYAHVVTDNQFGYELTTYRLFQDCYGNLMMAGVDISFNSQQGEVFRQFITIALIIFAVLLAEAWVGYPYLNRKINAPLKEISLAMEEYVADGKLSTVRMKSYETVEFNAIATAFNHMTEDIGRYVENIRTLDRESTYRQNELDIAAAIQRGLLPGAEANLEECRIRAGMKPARNVGGDLYDYMPLGDGRYLTVVADVSGKGVSAAMLMSVTLTLIRQYAELGMEPREILEKTNNSLTENNPEMLFVTAFVGIYDSRTETYTYSNAGHNRPYIAGKKLRLLDSAAGALLGLFEKETYENETVPLLPGETVFLYTDGVTEAVNPEHSFFGEQRLEQTLRSFRTSRSDNLSEYVTREVGKFSGDAQQADDITVLSLTARREIVLELAPEETEFDRIRDEILKLPLPRSEQLNLCLAAEEIFINICSYAYEGRSKDGEKAVFTLTLCGWTEMRFSDAGRPYNPLEHIIAPQEDEEPQMGGLGEYLTFTLTDEARYEYTNGRNILTLIRYFREEKENDD